MSKLKFENNDKLKEVQAAKLLTQLQFIATHSPYYQKLFSANHIDVATIKTIEDLKKLPLTSKDDFANNTPDFYCVSKKEIIEYCTTSGTTGHPLTVGLTKNDIARLALNEQYTFEQAGVTANDVVQLMLTLDKQFMAGLAYLQGLHNIGCAVVRSGPGSPAFQLAAINRHDVTVLVAVPSFLLRIIEYANTENIQLNSLSIKKIICIGEPIRHLDLSSNELAKKITAAWNVQLYGTYASTEMQTAFSECSEHNGGHLSSDLLIAEILDDNGNEVDNGAVGELVITHLGVEAMPLVRYQTGDMVAKLANPCRCGSRSLRLGPVVGRKNQLFKVNGTSIYPTSIFSLLKKFDVRDALLLVAENEMQHQLKLLIDCDETEIKSISASLFEQLKVKFEIAKADRKEINSYRNPDGRKPETVVFI